MLLHLFIVAIKSADGEISWLALRIENYDALASSLPRRPDKDLFLIALNEIFVRLRQRFNQTASALSLNLERQVEIDRLL